MARVLGLTMENDMKQFREWLFHEPLYKAGYLIAAFVLVALVASWL